VAHLKCIYLNYEQKSNKSLVYNEMETKQINLFRYNADLQTILKFKPIYLLGPHRVLNYTLCVPFLRFSLHSFISFCR